MSKMECFTKLVYSFSSLTIFTKHAMLDVWQGSDYDSGLLQLFCCDSKRDKWEHLIYAKLIKILTPNLEFSPYSEVIHRSTTFNLTVS